VKSRGGSIKQTKARPEIKNLQDQAEEAQARVAMIKAIVEYASRSGISKIFLDLKGVREDRHDSKVTMINNF